MKELEALEKKLSTYMTDENLELIKKYYKKALEIYDGMKRKTGEEYILHPIAVAGILASLKMDPVTIGSALLHEALLLDKMTEEEIERDFGEETKEIIVCLTKISNVKRTFKKESNVDHDRRVVVGLAENPKALFIRLADRTHNMRSLYVFPKEHREEIIEETQNILIPIAHRLGIKKIKSELEDLCLKYSKPEAYEEVKQMINADYDILNDALNKMKEELSELLREHEINFEIFGRVKSINGIHAKLVKGRRFSDIFDLLGLRIIVETVEECYLIVGLIHSKYRSIPKRFKDFIANPKSNMYQSIHTTVFGVDGRMFEVQIRTYEMDEVAERGVASHWSYKEKSDGRVKTALENKLEMFKSLIEANDKVDNEDFFKNLETELSNEEMYVYTPKGDIIELPVGSTPIDFAYKIHSEVGNTTVGAFVNNNIVTLDCELHDGDVVNLQTKAGTEPNKDWLKFVKTDTAKSRIKSYFSKQEKEKNLALGEELLTNYIKKHKIPIAEVLKEENLKRVLPMYKVGSLEELYLNIGSLKVTPREVYLKLTLEEEKEEKIKLEPKKETNSRKSNILVGGRDGILTTIASCCHPVYGEEIIGFITKGHGVTIHKKDCLNIKNSKRLIDVEWKDNDEEKYEAILNVYTNKTQEKLMDIIAKATQLNITVLSINLKKDKNPYYRISCKVKDINNLNNFIIGLNNLKFIDKVERVTNESIITKK